MVLLTSRSYKAWKISPPPRPNIILQSCKHHHLSFVRQVSDEDLESTEPSPKHLKSRIESSVHMLHNNESRPNPIRAPQPKRNKETSSLATRLLWGVIGAAAIINLLAFGLYTFFNLFEYLSPFESNNLRSCSTNANSKMVYLDDHYSVISESPYSNQPRHREVYDQYPSEQTDATQFYDSTSSNDVRLKTMERKIFPHHETDRNCVPMSQWQFLSFPTCNAFHEREMVEQRMLASGNWRDTWLQKSNGINTITKTLKYEHTFQERYFEFSRVDALAMERLTSNPFIMGVRGFCGVSVITEQGKHPLGFVVGQLSPRDKLVVSIQVALSIKAVHEIDGKDNPASLVHNDINIDNIFWGDSGPLLNDFNIAVLMMKEKQSNKTCPFTGHFPNPQWKSPEEQSGPDGTSLKQLNEKVDIYAFGNILFRFLTGEGPWREYATSTNSSLTIEQKQTIAWLKYNKGATPSIPEKIAESDDPYTKVMLEAMQTCYRFNPKDRPTARGIARFLQMSLDDLDGISNEQ